MKEKLSTRSVLMLTILALVVALAPAASAGREIPAKASSSESGGGDQRMRLRCDAEGADDISMDARYESRGGRNKFDASFEAAPGLGFEAGEVLDVSVGGKSVGQIVLFEDLGGDIVGDLSYDTTAQPDDDDLPFPDGFPVVMSGTSVVVGTLGCDLD